MSAKILISAIIILGCFIGVVVLILTDKLNRAIAALLGAIITYFVLIFIEKMNYSVIVDLLFGSSADGFVNLHSLILIIGMMIIVHISSDAGVFQFLALKLVQMAKGKPLSLMIIFCGITVLVSAILNNILTVIILIPLTITVSRILNINPTPYILTQAILVNIGGTIFSISSIPNILITGYTGITFIQFFLNVGLLSLVIFGVTLLFFIFIYKKDLAIPQENIDILLEFNVWNLVQNKAMLYKSVGALGLVMTLFVLVPQSILPPDAIAISVAIVLILISKINPREIIKKIDIELIFYLLGIFIIAGAMDLVGIITVLGDALAKVGQGNEMVTVIFILWSSAFLSSAIDNIPITKVLIPVVGVMTQGTTAANVNLAFYGLTIGANWGDNITPMGDNILVVNLAEQNKRPISIKQFFKLGFATTMVQLSTVTIYFLLMFQFLTGFIVLITVVGVMSIIYLMNKINGKKEDSKISSIINRFRKIFTT